MAQVNHNHASLHKSVFSYPGIYIGTFLIALFGVVIFTIFEWFQTMPTQHVAYLWWYWRAYFWAELIGIPGHVVVLQYPNGGIRWQAIEVLNNQEANNLIRFYLNQIGSGFMANALWSFSGWLLLSVAMFKLGIKDKSYQLLEGVKQVSAKDHNRYLKRTRQKSHLKLGSAHWVNGAEVQHLLVCGDTGSGKSQLLNKLLNQIRDSGDLAIIYDPKGDMVSAFFNPELDVLYSPFDQRSPSWSVWRDLRNDQDIETFAEAVIKDDPHKDAFWTRCARMVLATAIKRAKQESMSFSEALDVIMTSGIDELSEWLKGSEVYSEFSSPKTAANIMSELKSQARALMYLPEVKDVSKGFSITEWLGNRFKQMKELPNKPQPWLFLPVQKKQKVVGRIIMGTWVELISNFILSQPTDRNRRIYLIADELPSLKKLSALPELLAEGRGYGVASVIAIQNFSQLMEIYGKDGAHALAGLCSSLVAFRTSDPQTTEYISKRFGNQIRKEVQNNQYLSKGRQASFNSGSAEHIAERKSVSETDLIILPDLQAYFRCKGVPNPVKIEIGITENSSQEPAYCPIKVRPTGMPTVKKQREVVSKLPSKNWDI